jgi:tetratricopeptide (TPR) repeat protein
LQAFDELDRSGVRDDYIEALVLSNFADVAIGIGFANVAEVALARSKRIEWSSSLASFEFRIFSALAQASSIAGDQLGALRFLRRCNNCAPSPALQLRSTVERARILSDIGENFSSREELDHAVRLSKSIDWANAREHDQRQLIFLAAQVASYSGKDAERLLARYDGLKSSLPDLIAARDDRFRGEELVARSAVLRSNGETARAIVALLDALEIFSSCEDIANAANVAVELAALTQESRYVAIARTQAEKQPQSILARKVARLEAQMFSGAPG